MTIAYIISAYKLPAQLVRLVSRLQYPGRDFEIHVDANTPTAVNEEMVRGVAGIANVSFLARHACSWGDFGHVRATLKGFDRIVASGREYDYVVLLTGQDYPIKSRAFVDDYLSRHDGTSFMNFRALPIEGLADGGYERLPERRLPYGLPAYFGSGYWALHRRAIEHVRAFLVEHPLYVPFFERARIPDEMFFQTILLNSPLRDTIVNDDLRFIKWPGPMVLRSTDWDEIRSAPDLFARKFDSDVDAEILDRIDRDILGGL